LNLIFYDVKFVNAQLIFFPFLFLGMGRWAIKRSLKRPRQQVEELPLPMLRDRRMISIQASISHMFAFAID
jgi:hypothetical protein